MDAGKESCAFREKAMVYSRGEGKEEGLDCRLPTFSCCEVLELHVRVRDFLFNEHP